MKFCPYCGADLLDENVLFCSNCGKKLPPHEAGITEPLTEEMRPEPEKAPKEKPSAKKKGRKKKTPKKKAAPIDDDLPQRQCPHCGKNHDFDYPQCPFCNYIYGK